MTAEQQPSPAERYALAKARQGSPQLEAFRSGLSFDLDPFQLASGAALERGDSVLVAAPTGAGKTVVAEFAVYLAMQQPRAKVFYTAPMKALSNQKFQEFVAEYGASEVGLLTGDTNINSGARIVVMTTEVLRNMLYADSDLLRDLSYVIMDEVHYLADRFRGAVWEEVIIHLPQSVRLVSLSATVSNAEEFGDWLQAVRGETAVIVSEERPVPLDQHVLVRSKMLDLFDSSGEAASHRVNPELMRLTGTGGRQSSGRPVHGRGRDRSRGGYQNRNDDGRMDRAQIVGLLDSKNLLPAIFFIFSRVGCDQAVRQVLRAGVRLTDQHEREEIRGIVEERCRTIPDEDLIVLGYWEWLDGLERGVAAHHAGMLPAFKEVVEELFQKKLVKAVFATETLALGINMPARTVVLEKLEKFNGEARVPITPGEYTQLTGRAGRRGIDVEGHSVIQWQGGLDPQAVASLASRRTYPLNSSFSPTYNMAVNLIEQFGRDRTRDILESSFAQFQADRSVVDIARKVRGQEEALEGYAKAMECHLGDFAEYAGIRRELGDLERKGLRGDTGSRGERDRRQRQLTALRKRMKQHPCHSCSDREAHARWAERWWRLKKQSDELRRQVRSRTGAVAKVFDRVTDVLLELGYLSRDEHGAVSVGPSGRVLRRIYGERDLLVAESVNRGLWNALDVPGLAAMAAALVYEPRREEGPIDERSLPRGPFRAAFDNTTTLWATLDDLERDNKLSGSNPVSAGLCMAMYRWAEGAPLDAVLRDAELAAGDFVRVTKQAIDLLDQLSIVADAPVGPTARKALDAIRRGIVAYSSVG
ncbi:ATP-dependent RNA helicase HelY [Homoserinimonas aerilata]|uniref:ATP-dependent RNA helicase HelY n=1 Tax=Homoserinimonas aerilata TaxID=1162970 RepID=A0A542YJ37_9MICO|nr:DEAD/DEAH box helicase [Homoserinimonas aerilata]TQL48108.1 ATP-dependent RNA helicase HelY [Homoserinimonas aerilata]